jgi:hypothetical protein
LHRGISLHDSKGDARDLIDRTIARLIIVNA